MSLVGVIITIGIVTVGAYALMMTQDKFSKTTRDVDTKESVVQELSNRSAILQTMDFLKLETTCAQYALDLGTSPGDCTNTAATSSHSFLYKWYNVDSLTKICIEISKCTKMAAGKMYVVHVTAHHESGEKLIKSTLTFRKAK